MTLAIAYALMTVEVLFGGRHNLAIYAKKIMLSFDSYEDRRGPQAVILGTAIAAALIVVARVILASRHLSRNERVALVVMLCEVFLFVIESISLHGMDRMLYHQVGPILLIGWFWATGGIVATCAAAITLRR
jgi:hypothetical protein